MSLEDDHVRLNFGKSEFAKHYSKGDNVNLIPIHGKLEGERWKIKDDLDYNLDLKYDGAHLFNLNLPKSGQSLIAVKCPLEPDLENPYEFEKSAILPWIEERGEWVKIDYRGSMVDSRHDWTYDGPYYLCESEILAIALLYNIPKKVIGLTEVVKTSPRELDKISLKSNGILKWLWNKL